MSGKCPHSEIKFLIPFIAFIHFGAGYVRRPTTTGQRVGLVQNKRFIFFSLALRGSCNVIEIILPSGEKGKSDQHVMPAFYLVVLVLNGVTIHTINFCAFRVMSTCKQYR